MKKLTKNCRVLIADGARAFVFENIGDAINPRLELLTSIEAPAPPSRELGESRGGRVYASAGSNRSAMEVTDFHGMAEEAFIHKIADDFESARASGNFGDLIVVLPPKSLAHWREHQSAEISAITIAQIAKDYSKTPKAKLASLLVKELERE